jgi:primary-amine oxidase
MNPVTIERCICLHEEDAGMSWKHFDMRTNRTEVRRARRLVISSISTIGNYEYASYWYLHQDGRIEYEMKATGIINTAGCLPGEPGKFGTEVAPGIVGHIHQHIFSARLDMEVDGPNNTVTECDTIALPVGPENPWGNAYYVQERALTTESKAQRDFDFSKMRYWRITNPNTTNWVGKPTAYKLEAKSAVHPYTHPDSPSGKRGRFLQHQLWVTPFDENERYPAGEFVNQSTGNDSLPAWTAKDRAIENTDVVLWHSFGVHHLPRPEDHPVQSCVMCGFTLAPSGFFRSESGDRSAAYQECGQLLSRRRLTWRRKKTAGPSPSPRRKLPEDLLRSSRSDQQSSSRPTLCHPEEPTCLRQVKGGMNRC